MKNIPHLSCLYYYFLRRVIDKGVFAWDYENIGFVFFLDFMNTSSYNTLRKKRYVNFSTLVYFCEYKQAPLRLK